MKSDANVHGLKPNNTEIKLFEIYVCFLLIMLRQLGRCTQSSCYTGVAPGMRQNTSTIQS